MFRVGTRCALFTAIVHTVHAHAARARSRPTCGTEENENEWEKSSKTPYIFYERNVSDDLQSATKRMIPNRVCTLYTRRSVYTRLSHLLS